DVWPAPVALPAGAESRGTAAAYPELGLLLVGLGSPPDPARPGTGSGGVVALRLADGGALWPAPVLFPDFPAPAGLSLGWVTAAGAAAAMQPAVFLAAGSRVVALNAV